MSKFSKFLHKMHDVTQAGGSIRDMVILSPGMVKIPGEGEMKPLGHKNYGSIPHIPGSRLGDGDHSCPEGQAAIAITKTRDKHDWVICQEKLDGSNVGIARVGNIIYALTRSGYLADSSPYPQHHYFSQWVYSNQSMFLDLLNPGERLVGEWLLQAHGTRYRLPHDPFVAFDLFTSQIERVVFSELYDRCQNFGIVLPQVLHSGPMAYPLEKALKAIAFSGHGAIDPVEGVVWRVERKGKVEFLCKYVRHDKKDGCYLPDISGHPEVWNYFPGTLFRHLYKA